MTFKYSDELLAYMQQKKLKNIVVEVITSDSSDFEITELHVHTVNERLSSIFREEKKFRSVRTEVGEVLLPPYVLEYDDEITFGLKKFLCFRSVSYTGIRL